MGRKKLTLGWNDTKRLITILTKKEKVVFNLSKPVTGLADAVLIYDTKGQPYVITLNKAMPVIVRVRKPYVSNSRHIAKVLHIDKFRCTGTRFSG